MYLINSLLQHFFIVNNRTMWANPRIEYSFSFFLYWTKISLVPKGSNSSSSPHNIFLRPSFYFLNA
jgi:hypothetical protein